MPDPGAAVLITRPSPDGEALAKPFALHEHVDVFIAPMTDIVDVPGANITPEGVDAVLLTSPRAVPRALNLKDLPTYTVGLSTAVAAQEAGFNVLSVGPGRADDRLVNLVPPRTRLLHPAGVHLSRDLAPAFAAKGVIYRREAVYEAKAITAWPTAASDFFASDREKFVTFMSARAVTVFADLAQSDDNPARTRALTAVCASERIGDTAKLSDLFENVHVIGSVEASRFVDFIALRRT